LSHSTAPCRCQNEPATVQRSFAHTFRIKQIPIAGCAALSAHHHRGFVPWKLSDAAAHSVPSFTVGV
jgi:hypothetical protein